MFDAGTLAAIARARAEYEATVAALLGDAASAPLATQSGLSLKPLYTPLDVPTRDYLGEIGFPGSSPFTRWRGAACPG